MKLFLTLLLVCLLLTSIIAVVPPEVHEESAEPQQVHENQAENHQRNCKGKIAAIYHKLKSQRQDIDDLYDKLAAQAKTIKQLQHALSGLTNNIKNNILNHIKHNGIYLGNRWRIAEEGTGSYEALVFRDMTTTRQGTDRRYAMFKGRYTDL